MVECVLGIVGVILIAYLLISVMRPEKF